MLPTCVFAMLASQGLIVIWVSALADIYGYVKGVVRLMIRKPLHKYIQYTHQYIICY